MGADMVQPYTAVGLIPTFWGARRRDDIKKNLDHLSHLTKAAIMLSNLGIPVRLDQVVNYTKQLLGFAVISERVSGNKSTRASLLPLRPTSARSRC
jgi:hypothetical protein